MYMYVCNSMYLTLIYHFNPNQDVFLNLTKIFPVCLVQSYWCTAAVILF